MSHLSLNPRSDQLIQDAYDDFILSREAKLLSPKTIKWYEQTAGRFVDWLLEEGIEDPAHVRAKHVRQFLAHHKSRGLADATVHGLARGAKALLRFFEQEGYIDEAPVFDMPKVSKDRPRILSPEDIKRLLIACRRGRKVERDRALLLVLLDTGVRRGEVTRLTWGDVDMKSGTVRVRGETAKSRTFRTVIVGANTRRALLRYRRTVEDDDVKDPLFDLTGDGVRQVLRRLEERTGIHATPHDFRRTFATLCLRDGMDVLTLQGLMGHSTLEMTRQYIRLVDEDLQQAHKRHGPVDRWLG